MTGCLLQGCIYWSVLRACAFFPALPPSPSCIFTGWKSCAHTTGMNAHSHCCVHLPVIQPPQGYPTCSTHTDPLTDGWFLHVLSRLRGWLMEKDAVQRLDEMLGRNRFLLLLLVGGVTLAFVSLSLQFLNLTPTASTERQLDVQEGAELAKSRKRVFPETHPPGPDSARDPYSYCNTPNGSEQAWEGHSPADYRLLSVQVMIRHGDRYPLYTIPKTKRPAIDCTLSASRSPSHPLLTPYISHMGLGGRAKWEAPLNSVPRIPNHSSCEVGELTQTGVVQHLHNGQLLRQAYRHHSILPSDWSPHQLGVETTSRSRTVQSGLAFLYGFLPDFDWGRVSVRHQWSTLFCGAACDCPARNRYLEEEQRRQYRLRVADRELEKTYADMARTVGVLTRHLRAANPIDSLLCHLCHGLPFPCASAGGRERREVSDDGAVCRDPPAAAGRRSGPQQSRALPQIRHLGHVPLPQPDRH
ncbi:hypothetical protein fugu_010677 [Takifugu bimaculatus]|uniref:2-phosphoxylose phosphatase 1 n=1 Tax=Takifugu bimaculatus TaxID=433685 RepID=A0A4Z2CAQ7_9TELE|nr:hypothetical protein fugu_010677 [Takifugu bimaculatus]